MVTEFVPSRRKLSISVLKMRIPRAATALKMERRDFPQELPTLNSIVAGRNLGPQPPIHSEQKGKSENHADRDD
jgi:hypothetical protein